MVADSLNSPVDNMTEKNLFSEDAPQRTVYPEDFLRKLAVAIKDRTTPEGKELQACLDRRAKRSKLLVKDILETEQLSAEDLSVRINVVD